MRHDVPVRFEHANDYAAPAAEVHRMLVSRDFREQVCRRQHALAHTVAVTPQGPGGTLVEVRRTQSMDGAPAAATKLVGRTVEVLQRETWSSPTEAEIVMEIPGKPGRLRGRIELREDGGRCREVVTGEVTVSVPLVGGKLERLVADVLVKALRREGEVGADWLAGSPG